VENADPHAFGGLPDEAIVERFARSIDGRGVNPATARFQRMDDPAETYRAYLTEAVVAASKTGRR
jgi:hypothetical protein